jgi:hypothetical protein
VACAGPLRVARDPVTADTRPDAHTPAALGGRNDGSRIEYARGTGSALQPSTPTTNRLESRRSWRCISRCSRAGEVTEIAEQIFSTADQ